MALTLHIACFCMFTWRFAGRYRPRLEKVMWVGVALSLAALAFVPDDVQPSAQFVIVMALTALFCLNCLHFSIQALRGRDREQQLLAACLLVFLGAAVHDLLLLFKRIDGLSYIPYTSIAVLIGMSAVQGLRHARSVRRIERFNEELEISVQRARDELAVTLAREHELALAHSRLQDRLDIARDLHDGLGGSLVRMTALVEQSGAPLQNRQFLSMLNLLRNDLRQTIDSGASADMKPPATPRDGSRRCATATRSCSTSWASKSAGMFRLLDRPALRLAVPGVDPADRGRTTNVIKHSRAGRASRCAWRSRALELMVEDDGAGFDVAAVCQAGISVGMRSMSTRIARVGGSLRIDSAPGRRA